MTDQGTIGRLRLLHPGVRIAARTMDCGVGWLLLIRELLRDLEELGVASLEIDRFEAVHHHLDVGATWDAWDARAQPVEHMLSAAWRRSGVICQHTGDYKKCR